MHRMPTAALTAWLLWAATAMALEPKDVCVLFNKAVPQSSQVAELYQRLRGVPAQNLIPLDVTPTEDISRADYDARIAAPVRKYLSDHKLQPKVLLTVYGIPLRVGPQLVTADEQAKIAKLNLEGDGYRKTAAELKKLIRHAEEDIRKDAKSPLADILPEKRADLQKAEDKLHEIEELTRFLQHSESQACVDSELMLLLWNGDYPLSRWVFNPLYRWAPQRVKSERRPVLMTARLDGPNPDVAKRIIEDSIEIEKKGLVGKVYVDARGLKYEPEPDPAGTGYGGYDESYREMAELLSKDAKMDVVLENTERLFEPGECPNCALYCGWYALRNYRECCKFTKGAVAWHLASFEAVSLRLPDKQWAGNLLRDGAAATIGPVAEPYTVGFPKPAEFYGLLVTGKYTLAECYAQTTMLTSWMMTLVGDPLYNPYAKTPKLMDIDVLPSPRRAIRMQ
ncbi:MAG: TIGR03790 family protein [Gemmataceae bacterium]